MKIKLGCHICGRPWGYIYNGTLVVESRHGGETHSNVISLQILSQLLAGQNVKIALMESISELAEIEWDAISPQTIPEQLRASVLETIVVPAVVPEVMSPIIKPDRRKKTQD